MSILSKTISIARDPYARKNSERRRSRTNDNLPEGFVQAGSKFFFGGKLMNFFFCILSTNIELKLRRENRTTQITTLILLIQVMVAEVSV